MKKGFLTLIATPISDEGQIHHQTKELLVEACLNENTIFVIEEVKVCRRRWLKWGLPRDKVEEFVLLNEHNYSEQTKGLIQELKSGKNVYLMSDCGLPAFCDPGRELVNACHENKIRVTASAFDNSVALAVALSGYNSDEFEFRGFLPKEKDKRSSKLKEIFRSNKTSVLMDTPYRLKRTVEELDKISSRSKSNKEVFIGIQLNCTDEQVFRGRICDFLKQNDDWKKEFVIVIA